MCLEMIVIRRFDFTSFAICLHTIAPSIRPKDANGMWKSSREMRIVSLIYEDDVIERILRHLGLWQKGCGCIPAPTRRAKRPSIRASTIPSPTTTPNRSWRSPPPETSGSAQVRLLHPLFSGPQPSGGSF